MTALLLLPLFVSGQTYNDELKEWRQGYVSTLTRGSYPMKAAEVENLRYFEPDADYRVRAKFTPVKGARSFVLKSENGGARQVVKEYGYADFELMGTSLRLHIYQLANAGDNGNYDFFVPFTDPTNSLETYRGGRYLNISTADFSGNKVTIDFNKCYNPRAAYVKGYPRIVPPGANHLKTEINAGEKTYGEDPGY